MILRLAHPVYQLDCRLDKLFVIRQEMLMCGVVFNSQVTHGHRTQKKPDSKPNCLML